MDCDMAALEDCEYRLAWMQGKPPLVAILSSAPVLAADECFDLLRTCAGELRLPVSLKPRCVDSWLALYTNHDAVPQAFLELFAENINALLGASQSELRAFLFDDAVFLDDTLWQRAFERVEVQFFFRVLVPRMLSYGRSPVELLACVGRGGPNQWDSIEKLVALDPLIVQHRRFRRLLNCDAGLQRERAEMLGECLGRPFPKFTKPQVKILLAAYMSRLSEMQGHRFREREIRALYDAIARDRGVGLRDPDLPESPEAFSKAIQRFRRFWKLPTSPDKILRDLVRALQDRLS